MRGESTVTIGDEDASLPGPGNENAYGPVSVMAEQADPDRLSRWMQVLQIVAVPLVIAAMGWLINSTIAAAQTRADYVQLAVNLLSSEKPTDDQRAEQVDSALRDWAVEVFADNTPTELDPSVLEALRTGSVLLGRPGSEGGFAFGPDGPLPNDCFIIVDFQARVYDSLISTTRGDRLGAGEYPAFELRTPDASLGLGQRVRIEQGWVSAEPDEAYVECR